MDVDFEFEEPWESTSGSPFLMEQIESELTEPHPLYGKVKETLAIRVDSDDVLVKTEDGYALVHLSWCRRSQPTGDFPHALYFNDWAEFVVNIYLPDLSEWRELHPPDVWSQMLADARQG